MKLVHSLAASGLTAITARVDLATITSETDQCTTVDMTEYLGFHEEIEVCDNGSQETMEEIMAAVDEMSELDARTYKRRIMFMATDLILDTVEEPEGLEGYSRGKMRKVLYGRLSNYGCWCDPNQGLLQARNGFVADPMDQACKDLFQCQKCLPIEHGESCPSADGNNREYKYRYNSEDEVSGISCDHHKNDQCGNDKCSCAKRFAETVASLWGEGDWQWDNAYWLNKNFVKRVLKNRPHRNTDSDRWFEKDNFELFDWSFNCALGTASPQNEIACCGVFPNIKPYNADSRLCCPAASRAYEPHTQTCCDDGRVRPIGEC